MLSHSPKTFALRAAALRAHVFLPVQRFHERTSKLVLHLPAGMCELNHILCISLFYYNSGMLRTSCSRIPRRHSHSELPLFALMSSYPSNDFMKEQVNLFCICLQECVSLTTFFAFLFFIIIVECSALRALAFPEDIRTPSCRSSRSCLLTRPMTA